jgi:hypothetical protein
MAANDEKPTDRIRVKHKGPGHHSTIARRTFNPEAHELLKSPAVDKSGRDVPTQVPRRKRRKFRRSSTHPRRNARRKT